MSGVLLDNHLPGHGITERSEQRPDSQVSLWEMAIKVNLGRLSVALTVLEEQVQAEVFQ